ncbi:MAG: glycosyltransferase [Armatimonadetes bacterium]|nr:glycosyltransferase [Armatimonadota bacterium]
MRAALVTTCLNEIDAIDAFLDAVLSQTRQPDDIVIVDANSQDGTISRILDRTGKGAPIRLIISVGASRSTGRNTGIEKTNCELIAVTDVGAIPRKDWFERIIAPLESNPDVDVVSGYYEPVASSLWEEAVCAATVPSASEVDPENFLPSSRSVAFRKSAWEKVAGYPDSRGLRNDTAEDTAFDLALRASGAKFVFEPTAIVEWRPNAAPQALFRQFGAYARGDAVRGLWFGHYTKAFVLLVLTLALIAGGFVFPPVQLGLHALLAAYWVRHALRARRRTKSLEAALLAPFANMIVDCAHVVGYAAGLAGRHTDGP